MIELASTLPQKGATAESVLSHISELASSNRVLNDSVNPTITTRPHSLGLQTRDLFERVAKSNLGFSYTCDTAFAIEAAVCNMIGSDLLFHSEEKKLGYATRFSGTDATKLAVRLAVGKYLESVGEDPSTSLHRVLRKSPQLPKPVVLAPVTACISLERALDELLLGGRDAIEYYDVDEDLQPTTADLRRRMARLQSENKIVVMNLITGGTTEQGIVHNTDTSSSIVMELQPEYTPLNIVDAAGHWWFLQDNMLRERSTFMNDSVDGIILDPTKWLAPFDSSFLMLRDRDTLKYSLLPEESALYHCRETPSSTSLLSHDDLLRRSPGRISKGAGSIVALYSTLLNLGSSGFMEIQKNARKIANYLAEEIQRSPYFDLLWEPETNVVNFTCRQGSNREFMVEFNRLEDNTGSGQATLPYSTSTRVRTVSQLEAAKKGSSHYDGFGLVVNPRFTRSHAKQYLSLLDRNARKIELR